MDSSGILHINFVYPYGFLAVSWRCYSMIS